MEKATANELYEALDWLIVRLENIEKNLAQKHLLEGSLILYDLTSTYVEGNSCPLATYGYNRDKTDSSRCAACAPVSSRKANNKLCLG